MKNKYKCKAIEKVIARKVGWLPCLLPNISFHFVEFIFIQDLNCSYSVSKPSLLNTVRMGPFTKMRFTLNKFTGANRYNQDTDLLII